MSLLYYYIILATVKAFLAHKETEICLFTTQHHEDLCHHLHSVFSVGKPSLEHSENRARDTNYSWPQIYINCFGEKFIFLWVAKTYLHIYACIIICEFFSLFNIFRLFGMSKWRLVCGFLIHQIVRICSKHLACFRLFCFKAVKPPSSQLSPLGRD